MPEAIAHRRADRCFATLRSDQRAKDQERNYRNDVALTGRIVSLDVVYESWFSQGRDPCSAHHGGEPRGLIVAECLQAFKLQ
ncbi:MAG: hypothetical protein ACOY5V_17295, partial [Pseudomonadota bacterium]